MQRFFALEFNHHFAFDHEISTETAVELHRFVHKRHRVLSLDFFTQGFQFVSETFFICRFEQSRPQPPMYLDRGSDNFIGEASIRHQRILTPKSAKSPPSSLIKA